MTSQCHLSSELVYIEQYRYSWLCSSLICLLFDAHIIAHDNTSSIVNTGFQWQSQAILGCFIDIDHKWKSYTEHAEKHEQ